MATLQETITLEGPLDDPEAAFARLEHFFLANGYLVSTLEELDDDTTASISFERGESGNSWWSSNMTELHSLVKASALGSGGIVLRYEIEVSGQRLTPEDLDFWKREREEAIAFASSTQEGNIEPIDLREEEKERAKGQWRSTMGTSLKGFITAFVILFMLMIIAQRMGLISY